MVLSSTASGIFVSNWNLVFNWTYLSAFWSELFPESYIKPDSEIFTDFSSLHLYTFQTPYMNHLQRILNLMIMYDHSNDSTSPVAKSILITLSFLEHNIQQLKQGKRSYFWLIFTVHHQLAPTHKWWNGKAKERWPGIRKGREKTEREMLLSR